MGWTSKPVKVVDVPEPVSEPLVARPPAPEPEREKAPEKVPAATP